MCYFKLSSDNVMLKNCNEHNHEKCDEKILNRQKISNAVKRKAVDDVSIRSSTIFTGTNKKLQ
jgi:hypothetical protein